MLKIYKIVNRVNIVIAIKTTLKIIILSVCILMIPNGVPVVVIRKHRLNIEVVIKSFSL